MTFSINSCVIVSVTEETNPDYSSKSPDMANKDFRERIGHYVKVYEPIDDSEGSSYIKFIDAGNKVILHGIHGFLRTRIASFVMNLHPRKKLSLLQIF